MGRFFYATIWTSLLAAEGHSKSAIGGKNPSAQALAFWISLSAHPQLQFLFDAEVFENSRFNDFSVGLTGDENRVLINNQL